MRNSILYCPFPVTYKSLYGLPYEPSMNTTKQKIEQNRIQDDVDILNNYQPTSIQCIRLTSTDCLNIRYLAYLILCVAKLSCWSSIFIYRLVNVKRI